MGIVKDVLTVVFTIVAIALCLLYISSLLTGCYDIDYNHDFPDCNCYCNSDAGDVDGGVKD